VVTCEHGEKTIKIRTAEQSHVSRRRSFFAAVLQRGYDHAGYRDRGMTTASGFGFACALLLSASWSATAQEPAGATLALDAARKECRQAHGRELVVGPEAIRSIDLTGDGRTDYIVDFDYTRCELEESSLCGTGGCELVIVVALPNGKFREVFRQHVVKYEIEPGDGARTIRFHLHGGRCGKFGPEPCSRR
jgi:hypothetical protein